MKTKFIGLEGFNEIESLSTVNKKSHSRRLSTKDKTVRFIKRAARMCGKKFTAAAKSLTAKTSVAKKSSASKAKKPQLSVLDRHYNANRSSENKEFSCSAKEAVAGFSFSNGKVYAHSAPKTAHRTHTIIKKRAILAVVACLSAVTLSCVTVAGALEYSGNVPTPDKAAETTPTVIESTQSTNPENDSIILTTSTADEALGAVGEDAYSTIENAIVNQDAVYELAGLYIDGKLIGATDDAEALKAKLNEVLLDYRKDYDDKTTTEFANSVEVRGGSFPKDTIVSPDELISMADGKFSISLSTDIVYTREVDYDTKTEYDDSEYSTYEEVKTEGKKGEELVTVRTTFVDGIQTDAVETATKTLKKATDKVVIKGSKGGASKNTSSSGSSSGTFCWPMPYTHNITSLFEWRWGRMHQGIDISAGGIYGEPIIAAADGTVTFSGGDNSGYGYYVTIDHGSGYSTLYGHCSSLAVSSGQYVSQGDVIGYVGSTGNSTGPHLHFEIREDGTQVNPLNYVS